jgi:toxin FitB
VIILDTNVISEPLKLLAEPAARAWLDGQPKETLYLTAPSLMELLLGAALLPDGKRKSGMAAAIEKLLTEFFAGRFLAFDREAARMYTVLAKRAMSKGHTITVAYCQIASIAAVHGFTAATRDTAPFVAAGIPVINPWKIGT